MGIPPGAELGIFAEVFVPNVMPADKRGVAIDDDDLAVIPEIELKPVRVTFSRVEWAHVYAGGTKLIHVGRRQIVTADFVVEHVAADACLRLCDERIFQTATQAVVVDDVELDEHVFASRRDGFEDGSKG